MEQIGKYRVVRLIGAGGMGRVYEAIDPVIGRRVAVKTLSLNILHDAEAHSRFFREAQAAGRLSHPHLITIYDTGESEGHPYLVMEYLEGEDLSRIIAGRQMSLAEKLQLMMQMCHGLTYAHGHGVVHRDIKPANIFLTPQGVKILDFGLARGNVSEVTQTGHVLGTPNYMAPEQIRGEALDHRADIFALGVVFYELLSGRKAFDGDSVAATIYKVLEFQPEPVHHWDATLPTGLSAMVQRALAKDRNARYQRVDEMLVDITRLKAAIDPDSSSTRPTGAFAPPAFPRAARRVAGLAWGAAILLFAVAAIAVWSSRQRATPAPVAEQPAPARETAAPAVSAPVPPPATASTPATVPAEPERPAQTPAPPATAGAASRRSTPPVPERTAASATRPAAPPPVVDTQSPRRETAPPEHTAAPPAAPPETRPPAAAPVEPTHVTPPPPIVAATPPSVAPPPAPVPAPAPAAPAENPAAAVQETLGRYKAALEARNFTALKQIWPSLSGRQETATRSEFANARSIVVEFANVNVQLTNATTATVTCRRNYVVTTLDNRTLQSATRMIVTMERQNTSWVIGTIRHEADR